MLQLALSSEVHNHGYKHYMKAPGPGGQDSTSPWHIPVSVEQCLLQLVNISPQDTDFPSSLS